MDRRRFLAGCAGIAMLSMPWGSRAALEDGFFVPAEDVRHEATFLQWPVSREVHPDPVFRDMVQDTIAEIANTIAEFEPVILLAVEAHHRAARRKLSDRVTLWDVPTEDLWCRDAGPIFAINDAGDRGDKPHPVQWLGREAGEPA